MRSSLTRPRKPLVVGAGVVVLLFLAVLWQTAMWTERSALADLHENAQQTLKIYAANLQSELEKFEPLPRLLATNDLFKRALTDPENSALIQQANLHLEHITGIVSAASIYLIDPSGLTIASSNWSSNRSFVGKNFGFRPYYKQAMSGSLGRYFALGVTSRKRGYYFAYPVKRGRIIGVVAVKVDIDRLEQSLARGPEKLMVTDDYGVVFLTTNPKWTFNTYRPLSPESVKDLQQSRRYGNIDHPLLSKVSERALDENSKLMTILETEPTPANNDGTVKTHKTTYLVQETRIPEINWNVHILTDIASVADRVRASTVLAGIAFVLLGVIAAFFFQRRLTNQEKLQLRREGREAALWQAREQLEIDVQERTADLRQANERLQREMAQRQRAERASHQAQDELVQAGKLAALGQMAAGINHELRQPLTAIGTYSDNARLLIERDRADEALENLSAVTELTVRMSSIIGNLSTFSRKTSRTTVPVSLHAAVENTLLLLEAEFRASGVTVVREVPESEVFVMGEMVRLEQVLVNLCRNALDAMSDSRVRELHLSVVPIGTQVSVAIRDTGPGIPEKHIRRIFDPFFTTKQVDEGLGLGLSITHAIVKGFGGSIKVANEARGGVVFTLLLQRRPDAAEKVA